MRSRPMRVPAIAATAMFVAAACGGGTPAPTTSGSTGPSPTTVATVQPTAAPTFGLPSFSPAALRWYCCLGTGEDPSQTPTEKNVAAALANVFPGSSLKFEVVTYDDARNTLATQISGGNSPDIAGPVGIAGLAAFANQWLDVTPAIAASHYDLGQFDPAAVDFYRGNGFDKYAIPFDTYPSMLWYKRDMFSEIGLNEPPHKYGDPYTMPDGSQVDWNYDTLRTLAMKLTVDKNNKDATDPAFDWHNIVQYGFEPQRDELRGLGAYWGAGNLTGPDGKTVVIPDAWKVAWKFFYDGMWKDHFIMTGQTFAKAEWGGSGYAFFSGHVAMSENFLWTTYGVADAGTDWDLAAIPAYNGKITSPLNADTFAILKSSPHPDAAFAGLTYLLGDAADQLTQLYGGMPARLDRQDAFFEQLAKTDGFPEKVDWQVVKDSLAYADKPNFEASMPKYNQTLDILNKYLSVWTTTPGLDMDAQIEALRAEIQKSWDAS